jgi:hypothetical protein
VEAGADIAQLREDGELGGRASSGAWRRDAEPDLLTDEAMLVQIVSWGNQLLRVASVGDAAPICRVLLGGDDRSGKSTPVDVGIYNVNLFLLSGKTRFRSTPSTQNTIDCVMGCLHPFYTTL